MPSAGAGVRRDREQGEPDSGTGGQESLSELENPGEKGESQSKALTLPELRRMSAVASNALERRPSPCSFSS